MIGPRLNRHDDTLAATHDSTPVSLSDAFWFWLKLGFISFGGPAGQIAIMHRELVEKRSWISEQAFLHALNYCMLLPGPEAQQLATYIGLRLHRTAGGLMAGLLFILPSLIMLMALSWVYLAWGHWPLVKSILWAIKPVVVAIVVQAIFRIGARTLRRPVLWGIALAAFIGITWAKLPFPLILLLAAGAGWLSARGAGQLADTTEKTATPSDETRLRSSRSQALRVLIVGAVLWALPMLLLATLLGHAHLFTQMAWFFTKSALVTFGGAYAVLPYVQQAAVGQYGWLTGAQMIDGLALGETTPGPLIMVVAFVGFVGGHTLAPFGAEHALAAAIGAALVVTYFTFLPSFIFIFAGAPMVEASHRQPALAAPLAGITAAVVGVIGHLALVFGAQVFLPQGAGPDWAAACVFVLALSALIPARRGVVEVIALAALAGALMGWAQG
ncbi:MAG: Chromate transporter, chromate ion transporter family [Pseudomonadota bacterium]|jgi:chromate transporter